MNTRKAIRLAAGAAAALLAVIGARFLVDPLAAQRTFGLGKGDAGHGLHLAVGLRDLWLAALLGALAILKAWQALAVWFALGALVCLGDAAVVAAAGARWPYVAFHAASGLFCAGAAALAWRAGRSAPQP